MNPIKDLKPGQMFVGTSEGLRGHFVVVFWINPDMGGFIEPWESDIMSYATHEECAAAARIMAADIGLPLYI